MPKRKKDRSDDCDFDYLAKKLRKIERKISRKRGRRTLSSDSDMSLQDQNSSEKIAAIEVDVTEPQECYSYWEELLEQSNVNTHHSDVADTVATVAAPVASASPQLQPPNDPVTANESIAALPDVLTERTLSTELLSILGEDQPPLGGLPACPCSRRKLQAALSGRAHRRMPIPLALHRSGERSIAP
ncbi:jg11755 [Pararge aegeria aegeria]|uniref:Jg11755 protein n=1 Tax=Pararge aegeria aegeria TaxID=348720 RepID=A0A8S4RW13_9NEOP|nr:jg11755 [Pararge aegeria aegeria]